MIGFLEGVVKFKRPGAAIISVAGIGHVVHCSEQTLEMLVPGEPAELFIEDKISEADRILYGFALEQDQNLFVALCKVQKVGGKVALAIIDELGHDGFCQAILDKDEKALKAPSGVGPGLAKRLIAETSVEKYVQANYRGQAISDEAKKTTALVKSGLVALGYLPGDVQGIVPQVIADLGTEAGPQALIKEVLKRLQIAA